MKKLLNLLFFLISVWLEAKQTICLNMIVKNESSIIAKNLASAKKVIDTWVIVDTGSTDGTQEVIRKCMKEIPGELYERPWVNFEHNRNEALALARGKADYILIMDADEEFLYEPGFKMPPLTKDGYRFSFHRPNGAMAIHRLWMIRDDPQWRWVGVLHETLQNPEPHTVGTMEGMTAFLSPDDIGYRSADPDKYRKDAKVLEAALEKEPNNSRYVFYLASSYLSMKEYAKALPYYEKRATMGGFEEEVFLSLYNVAQMKNALHPNPATFLNDLTKAYLFRPTRAEPIHMMVNQFICLENYFLGYLVSKFGLTIPLPQDSLYVQPRIYDWGLLYQHAFCAAQLSLLEEATQLFSQLSEKKSLPPHMKAECEKGIAIIKKKTVKKDLTFIGLQ